ncbi:hypothetical protein GCM10025859_10810 [Alicyclobacillus fastidiosus]|nr:hypothetical protein GCM10025859_10810 [Alicyclobacillus fastidiosus]
MQALRENPESFLTTYGDYASRPIEEIASQLHPTDDKFTRGAFAPDNRLVGTATFVREMAMKVRHKASLQAMFVANEARRRGVGRNLLADLIVRARRLPGDFHAMADRLRQKCVRVIRGPVERGGGWTINFLDPDGTQLKFHTATLADRMTDWV